MMASGHALPLKIEAWNEAVPEGEEPWLVPEKQLPVHAPLPLAVRVTVAVSLAAQDAEIVTSTEVYVPFGSEL
jgi:hypothetical protein